MIPYDDDLTALRKLKTNDPYKEVIQIVTNYCTILGSFIAWVYTGVNGFDTVFCEYDGNYDNFIWEYDWYEGGDVYLIAYSYIQDLEFDIAQKWGGYQ